MGIGQSDPGLWTTEQHRHGDHECRPGDFRLFRGNFSTSGDFFATLPGIEPIGVRVNFLRDLDLHVYDGATGELRAESITTLQNVEQVGMSHAAGPFVVKVRAEDDGRTYNEPFAVAMSDPGFAAITGPIVGVQCSAPATVAAGSTVTVNCTITNTGDTALVNGVIVAKVDANPSTTAGTTGTVSPNANVTRSFTVTAPSSGTSFLLTVSAGSLMFNEFFIGSRTLTVQMGGVQVIKPIISPTGGIVNAASSQAGLSSSQWVTIRGTDLAPVTRTLGFVNGVYPTVSDGVSVTVDGKPAYLYYLSPTQINIVTPDLNRTGSVPVVVTSNGVASDPINVSAQSASPAAFLWPGGYAVATDLNYGYKIKNGTFAGVTTTPAKPGEVIILWVTGLGPTNPPVAAGHQVPNQIYSVAGSLRVTIGGAQAELFGAALAPGNASLYQIALRVPELANGDHSTVITANGIASVPSSLTVQR